MQDWQTRRSDMAARNSELGRPIPCLGQPASGLETGEHRSRARRHQAQDRLSYPIPTRNPTGRKDSSTKPQWDATNLDEPVDGPPSRKPAEIRYFRNPSPRRIYP